MVIYGCIIIVRWVREDNWRMCLLANDSTTWELSHQFGLLDSPSPYRNRWLLFLETLKSVGHCVIYWQVPECSTTLEEDGNFSYYGLLLPTTLAEIEIRGLDRDESQIDWEYLRLWIKSMCMHSHPYTHVYTIVDYETEYACTSI